MALELINRLLVNVSIDANNCWNWKKYVKGNHGYPYIKIGGKMVAGHRLIWIIFKGNIPDGLWVLHRCDNRRCLNPEHLFLGDRYDNAKDAAIKNRFVHKLQFSDIAEIRRLHLEGFSQVAIGKRLGITQGHVSKILHKKRRQHV